MAHSRFEFYDWHSKLGLALASDGMEANHTTYIRNNMGQKCEGNCGLWVLNEIIKKNILKI